MLDILQITSLPGEATDVGSREWLSYPGDKQRDGTEVDQKVFF
jgi:hypothetical protein